MHKSKFCIIPNKALINEESVTMSQSTIYNNNENEIYKNKNLKKLKESFFNKDFRHQNISYLNIASETKYMKNYIMTKNILKKFTIKKKVDIGLIYINNIMNGKKCHFTSKYNEMVIFTNKNEYIKKYYKYSESIKIIPKREAYFKHLMQFLERPFFRNFANNKIINQIGLDKLSIYRRVNYPKKLCKNIDLNNNICNNNIIFNSNVIETIENCSTTTTQYSNRNNNNLNVKSLKSKNNFVKDASIISEIKVNNCSNKKNDDNISCIDNSLIIIMKDLCISQNKINAYLCQHNTNYKNLYYKIKNKTKIHSDFDEKNKIEDKKNKLKESENKINKKMFDTKKLNNINYYKKILINKNSNNNIVKYKEHKNITENENCHNSVSSHKKINKIPIIPLNSNNLNSQINNKNSCCNTNKFCLSSFVKTKPLKIHNLKKKFNTNKNLINEDNHNFFNIFNSYSSKEKNNNLNLLNFINNNKIICNLNNNEILQKVKKIVKYKKPKNKSMKKNINTQKLLTDYSQCMLDFNSLNENEAKRKYQTINAVKSISISNNQFCNKKNEFKKDDYK